LLRTVAPGPVALGLRLPGAGTGRCRVLEDLVMNAAQLVRVSARGRRLMRAEAPRAEIAFRRKAPENWVAQARSNLHLLPAAATLSRSRRSRPCKREGAVDVGVAGSASGREARRFRRPLGLSIHALAQAMARCSCAELAVSAALPPRIAHRAITEEKPHMR